MNRNVALPLLLLLAGTAADASLVATYDFNNTLNAVQPGVTALTAVDPMGLNAFQQNVTVFGTPRTVYHFDGSSSPATDQGGLQLDTTGLIGTNNYSVEMVFELDNQSAAWRRVLDSLDRQSDNGLYVDPSNHLDAFPVGAGTSTFQAATFFDVFVTVDLSDNIGVYLSGLPEFSVNSNVLDISAANHLNFFLDNLVGGGQGEWSKGDVSLIKVYNTALTADQVLAETADPFAGTGVPEPGSWWMMFGGLAILGAAAGLKRRSQEALTSR